MGTSKAAVICGYPPKSVFIPLFIIFAAAALLIAGCNDDTIVDPVDCGDDCPGEPVCADSLKSVEILLPPFDAPPTYPNRIPFVLRIEDHASVAGMRYLLVDIWDSFPGEDSIIGLLNEQPELFEEYWSEWRSPEGEYDAILVGEDNPLSATHLYLFAVQMMDSCGRADSLFTPETNAREFRVSYGIYPTLYIADSVIGLCSARRSFYDPDPIKAFTAQVPAGLSLDIAWWARLTYEWMPPVEYRYGWDIQDIGNDDEWSCDWSPLERRAYCDGVDAGVRVLYIEARDAALAVTRVKIEFVPVQLQMDRDLLWVDDWRLGDYVPSMTDPSEEAHDEFWTDICSMAPGFDALSDIYPADEMYDGDPLPLDVLSRYKHVIWTYSRSIENVWKETIIFQPRTYSLNEGFRQNTLALYLAGGGSVLTCGRTDGMGGFYETFTDPPLLPASVIDELSPDGFDSDIARFSMAHDDFYITVIDKVVGQFKSGEDMVPGVSRSLSRDALMWAYEAEDAAGPDFPDTLMLDEIVTCSTCFFNPQSRGFTYVEVYDPAYYMDHIGASSHPCFTPIYRMMARSTISPLHGQPVAIRGTIGGGPGSCEPYRQTSYESYHFGFPLWFMEHEKVEQIADEIFRSWDIR